VSIHDERLTALALLDVISNAFPTGLDLILANLTPEQKDVVICALSLIAIEAMQDDPEQHIARLRAQVFDQIRAGQ
jgi:hypothetical protein